MAARLFVIQAQVSGDRRNFETALAAFDSAIKVYRDHGEPYQVALPFALEEWIHLAVMFHGSYPPSVTSRCARAPTGAACFPPRSDRATSPRPGRP